MKSRVFYSRQQGIVLIVSMMLLVVVSLMGMESITTSIFGNRLQTNDQDNHRAFQSAQYALNTSQAWLVGQGVNRPLPQATQSASSPIWLMDKTSAGLGWWTGKPTSWWYSTAQSATNFPSVSAQARYFIEEDPTRYTMNLAVGQGYGVNDDSRVLFRITSSAPGAGTARMQLQSMYALLAIY